MAKTRLQKEETVSSLTDKLRQSKSVVFTDYQGLTMKILSDLRKALREQKAEFAITKNTLIDRALKGAGIAPEAPAEIKTGPTATLFAYEDEVMPLKTLVKALKDAQIGKIKAALFGGQFLDTSAALKLSTLPSKPELHGQVVGTLVSPLRGLVFALHGNLQNLVYALDQIKIKKSSA